MGNQNSGRPTLPKDCICFNVNKIQIGDSVAMFFFKQEVSDVLLTFDFNDRSMIIESVTPEKIKAGRCINGLSISSVQPEKKRGSERWVFGIDTHHHTGIIDMTRRNLIFKATPIAKDKIIIRDLPFIGLKLKASPQSIIDIDNKIVTFQSVKISKMQSGHPAIGYSKKWIIKLRQNNNQNNNQNNINDGA